MYGKKTRQLVQGFVDDVAKWNDFCCSNIQSIYNIRSQMTAFPDYCLVVENLP